MRLMGDGTAKLSWLWTNRGVKDDDDNAVKDGKWLASSGCELTNI